jgi:hypothetical protein
MYFYQNSKTGGKRKKKLVFPQYGKLSVMHLHFKTLTFRMRFFVTTGHAKNGRGATQFYEAVRKSKIFFRHQKRKKKNK